MVRVESPHVVLIAWGFPPSRGSGVYRAVALANSLAAAGFRVTVLTCEEDFWERSTGSDSSMLAAVNVGIDIIRIPFSWPELERHPATWGLVRRTSPRVWQLWRYWRRQALNVMSPGKKFERPYWSWLRPLIRELSAVHRRDRIDLIVATTNPYVAGLAAREFHDATGTPYVIDNRDAFSLHTFQGQERFGIDSPPGRLERQIFDEATEIWFVNRPILEWYANRFPALAPRMQVVSNGWDARFVHSAPLPESLDLRFAYVGTISASVPLRELLSGWAVFHAAQHSRGFAVHLDLFGYSGFTLAEANRDGNTLGDAAVHGVTYYGPVHKEEVNGIYQDAHATVLLLPPAAYVTSGKVFEYMAIGKPIVSVHQPGGGVSDYLESYPLWFPCASLSTADIAAAFEECATALRAGEINPVTVAQSAASQFERSAVLTRPIQRLYRIATSR